MEEPEKIVSQTELDDRAQKLVEDKDADSRLRVYIGPMEKALTAVLLIWAAFQVWANMFGTLGAVKLRTAHIMFLLPLAFTLYPTFKKERRRRRLMPVWDIAPDCRGDSQLRLSVPAIRRGGANGAAERDGRVGRRGLPAGRL